MIITKIDTAAPLTKTDLQISQPASLRLLQVLEPSGGGSGRHFLDLCNGLRSRGHSVHAVYSPIRAENGFVQDLMALGLASVHAIDMERAPGLSDIAAHRALSGIARTHGPFDAIHAHSSKAGALTRLRLPGPHIPRVYTPHAFRTMDPTLGRAGRLIYGSIELWLARHLTDRLICVSQDERRHALSLGMPEDRVSVVINGVATPSLGGRHEIRARFGIPASGLVFGFVGRLSAQKAPERLLEAFRRIASDMPNAHLLMVGFGEEQTRIEAFIAEAGLGDRAHLASGIGSDIMAAFDVLVMPSRYEAMSYVLLEAGAAGLPIVITDVGGARTVVDDGHNGLIVPNSDDIADLAAAMATFSDPARLHQFRQRAIARKDNYSVHDMIEKTEAIYRSLQKQS